MLTPEERRRVREIATRPRRGDADDAEFVPVNGTNGHGAAPEKPKPELILTRMDTVQPEPVRWLWRHWLPEGALCILDGDPGVGKSTFTLDLAARVSRGWRMPPDGGHDPEREPAGVVLLTAEDSLAHTVRPRLDAAGADPERVVVVEGVKTGDAARPIVLPWDLEMIEAHVRAAQVQLIIVDPLTAYLGGEYDAHKDQDVRRGLRPLAALAERLSITLLLLRHLNKLSGGAALYRGGGSIAITGAARSSLIVGRDPNDDTGRTHVLAMNKPNLGPMPTSLAYRFEPAPLDVVRVAWIGQTDLKAHDILSHPTPATPTPEMNAAERFIRKVLAGGPMEADAFKRSCEEEGLADVTVRRARKKIGVVSKKRFDGGWTLHLPDEGAHPFDQGAQDPCG